MNPNSSSDRSKRLERRMVALSGVMILLSLFLLGQVTGKFTGQVLAKETTKEQEADFYEFADLLAEVYQEIKAKYVEEVDDKEIFQGAIQGMFMALDPHSQYLNADSFTQLEKDTEGEFTGIGIHINIMLNEETNERELTVIAPIPGSPAFEVGLEPWDRIIEIEGETTSGITTMEAVKKLTGPTGSKVNITVRRRDEADPLHFTITRKRIKIESIYSQMLPDGIVHVRIERFSENTTRDLKKHLSQAKAKGAEGLILDLRNNWGGLLKEAITVSDLFLDKGLMVVSTKGRVSNQNREHRAESDKFIEWPMLVLINSVSASASEIVAGAMKDHKRAPLVGPKGKRTYGKGSVQTIEPLRNSIDRNDDGNLQANALRLTTARYYTPNGTAIDNKDPKKRGLAPDLEVEVTLEQERNLYRHGLIGAPDQVEPGTETDEDEDGDESDDEEADDDGPVEDVQLDYAIEEMKRMIAGHPTPIDSSLRAEGSASPEDSVTP